MSIVGLHDHTLEEQKARRLVVALATELEKEIGGMAAMVVGPMMAIPPLKVVEIADRVVARYQEIKEQLQ